MASIQRAPSKSTLSYQNEHRSCEMFRESYYRLLDYVGQQRAFLGYRMRMKTPVKLLDSTIVSLCMTLYDWALYTHTKGAVKRHSLLDFDMLLPEYVCITDGKVGDNTAAREIPVSRGGIVVSDRYYCNFLLLNDWDSKGVFFAVRHRSNLCFHSIYERDLPEKRHQNILIDETIELDVSATRAKYPRQIRRVVSYDVEHDTLVELLTNIFKLAASTIVSLYRARWQIEIFFRNLKQLFHIKSFVGTSRNAVEIQIWTALITILLLSWLKQTARYPWHLSNLVSSLRLNTFTKIDLQKWLDEPFTPPPDTTENA